MTDEDIDMMAAALRTQQDTPSFFALQRGVRLSEQTCISQSGKTCSFLHLLAEVADIRQHTELLQYLTEYEKPNIDKEDADQYTALDYAVQGNRLVYIQQLREWGADPLRPHPKTGINSLGMALEKGQYDALTELQVGIEEAVITAALQSQIPVSIQQQNRVLLLALLTHGVTLPDYSGSPLWKAILDRDDANTVGWICDWAHQDTSRQTTQDSLSALWQDSIQKKTPRLSTLFYTHASQAYTHVQGMSLMAYAFKDGNDYALSLALASGIPLPRTDYQESFSYRGLTHANSKINHVVLAAIKKAHPADYATESHAAMVDAVQGGNKHVFFQILDKGFDIQKISTSEYDDIQQHLFGVSTEMQSWAGSLGFQTNALSTLLRAIQTQSVKHTTWPNLRSHTGLAYPEILDNKAFSNTEKQNQIKFMFQHLDIRPSTIISYIIDRYALGGVQKLDAIFKTPDPELLALYRADMPAIKALFTTHIWSQDTHKSNKAICLGVFLQVLSEQPYFGGETTASILFEAIQKGNIYVLKSLIPTKMSVNTIDHESGKSLLMLACESENIGSVHALLERDANLFFRTATGVSVHDIGMRCRNQKIPDSLNAKTNYHRNRVQRSECLQNPPFWISQENRLRHGLSSAKNVSALLREHVDSEMAARYIINGYYEKVLARHPGNVTPSLQEKYVKIQPLIRPHITTDQWETLTTYFAEAGFGNHVMAMSGV